MKTIQQVLRESDHKSIENLYFYEHPVNLWEVKEYENLSIGEFHGRISARFQSFLKKLCELKIQSPSDNKQGILFVYKSQVDDKFLGHDVGLVHADELMEETDLSEVSTYAYEFTDRREALGFLVADTKLTQDNLDEVIVSFLFEIFFFGYEQEHLEEEKKKLDESIKECEEHPERLMTFSHEDFCKKYGLPIEEEYPEESERKHNFYEAGMEYTKYCKKIELEKIKTFLINHNFNGSLIEFPDEK